MMDYLYNNNVKLIKSTQGVSPCRFFYAFRQKMENDKKTSHLDCQLVTELLFIEKNKISDSYRHALTSFTVNKDNVSTVRSLMANPNCNTFRIPTIVIRDDSKEIIRIRSYYKLPDYPDQLKLNDTQLISPNTTSNNITTYNPEKMACSYFGILNNNLIKTPIELTSKTNILQILEDINSIYYNTVNEVFSTNPKFRAYQSKNFVHGRYIYEEKENSHGL